MANACAAAKEAALDVLRSLETYARPGACSNLTQEQFERLITTHRNTIENAYVACEAQCGDAPAGA